MIAWDLDNTLIDRDAALGAFFTDWLARRFPNDDIAPLLAFICAADHQVMGTVSNSAQTFWSGAAFRNPGPPRCGTSCSENCRVESH